MSVVGVNDSVQRVFFFLLSSKSAFVLVAMTTEIGGRELLTVGRVISCFPLRVVCGARRVLCSVAWADAH